MSASVEVGYRLHVQPHKSGALYSCYVVSKNEDGTFVVKFSDDSFGLQEMGNNDSFRILDTNPPEDIAEIAAGCKEKLAAQKVQEQEAAKLQQEKEQANEQQQRDALQSLKAGVYTASCPYIVRTDADNYSDCDPNENVDCKYRVEIQEDRSLKVNKKEEGNSASFNGRLDILNGQVGIVWTNTENDHQLAYGHREQRDGLKFSVSDSGTLQITDTYDRWATSDRRESRKRVVGVAMDRQ